MGVAGSRIPDGGSGVSVLGSAESWSCRESPHWKSLPSLHWYIYNHLSSGCGVICPTSLSLSLSLSLVWWVEEAFEKLQQTTVPEMQRSNLAPVILQLKALGVDNVLRFHFLSVSSSLSLSPSHLMEGRVFLALQPPPADAMLHALELLYALGGVWEVLLLVTEQ